MFCQTMMQRADAVRVPQIMIGRMEKRESLGGLWLQAFLNAETAQCALLEQYVSVHSI